MADLIVPLTSPHLPPLPAGLPLLNAARMHGLVIYNTSIGKNLTARLVACDVPGGVIDLAAPPVDADGNPTRMDAIWPAIGWLEARGLPALARALRHYMVDACLWSEVVRAAHADGVESLLTEADGLHRPTAGRAVVAAALRQGVGCE